MTKCCTEKCYFTKGSECSPVHHGCCTDSCKIAPKGERCYSVTGDSEGCVLSATCNGVDFDCPQIKHVEDDTSCGDRGRCKNGTCIPFCEYRNLTSCICENMHETCYICCSSEGHECNPYDGIIKYSDGRPCLQGYCQNILHPLLNIPFRRRTARAAQDTNPTLTRQQDNTVAT
ncbi:hypothetical protein Ahia01_000859000 [Argonauta hians]